MPEHEVQDDRGNNRKDDARCKRDVNSRVAAPECEIAWKMETTEKHQCPTHDQQDDAKDEEQPPNDSHSYLQ